MAGIFGLLMSGAGVIKDQYYNLTSLLLPGNGTNGAQNNTFLDGSGNTFTITRNGNTTQGTFSPFSQTGWSNYYNGSGYFSSSTALFAYTTGNASTQTFTIEAMVYHTARTTPVFQPYSQCIAGKGNVYMNFGINGTGNLIFLHNDGTERIITSSSTVPLNTWTYVAIVVSGGTATMYIGNSSVGTGTWYGIAAGAVSSASYFGKAATAPDANVFQGYISNLRVSSVARTAAIPTSGYANDANTVFLFNSSNQFVDKSSNGYAITVASSGTSVTPFSPFAPTQSYSAAAVGGSGYFDGTGDYLDVANNAALQLGTSDFTLETWAYLIDQAGTKNHMAVSKQNYYLYYQEFDSKWVFETNLGSISSSSTWPMSTWQHIAATRSGNTFTLWVNGTSQGTLTNSGSVTDAGGLMNIGRNVANADNFVLGYLSNTRLVKGTAVYTGAFTPPSLQPLTNAGSTSAAAYPSTTNVNTSFASSACSLLLNFTNAGVVDATAKNVLETVGNAQISTTGSKWGAGSIYLPQSGTTDYLPIFGDTKTLLLGTGIFVIEFWFKTTSSVQYAQMIGNENGASGDNGFTLLMNVASSTSGEIAVYRATSGQINATTSSYRDGNWHHLAFVRDASGSRLYLDGSQAGSTNATQAATNFDASAGVRWSIGENLRSTGRQWAGNIDDMRITRGYNRGYTGSTITVPTAPFPLQ